jgi:hypothetical protein
MLCGRAGPPRFMPGGSIRLNSVGFTANAGLTGGLSWIGGLGRLNKRAAKTVMLAPGDFVVTRFIA